MSVTRLDSVRSEWLACSALALLLTLAGCDAPDATAPLEPAESGAARSGDSPDGTAVATPFRADAHTLLETLEPDPACGDPPWLLDTQVGEGRGGHLGRFTIRVTFCVDVTDLLDDGVLTEGESLPYDRGRGTLVAPNGDELHMEIAGVVLPSDDPAFDFEFHDPFRFVGGTGRFAGAGGEGEAAGYGVQATDLTTLRFRATLVLSRAGDGSDGGESDGTVAVLPEDWTIPTDATVRFRVERTDEAPAGEIVWSVNGVEGGNEQVGTIDAEGLYTAPSTLPPSTVEVRAQVAGSATAHDVAPVEVVTDLGALGVRWEDWQPRVVPVGGAAPVVLEVVLSGYPSSVELDLQSGGTAALLPVRSGTYGIELSPTQLLGGYAEGDLHSFVGFLQAFDGSASTPRFNTFVNVLDATVPPVSPTRLADDAQATDHLVNLRYDPLLLGGAIPPEVTRRFYDFFPDDFDFLAVVEQVSSHNNRSYRAVSNETDGIGQAQFDRSAQFGSAGELEGMIDYPIGHFFDLGEKNASHELGHRWAVFLDNDEFVGDVHWPVSSLAYGIMGFSIPGSGAGGTFPFRVVHVEGDVFEIQCADRAREFNDMELYLMGMIPPDEVGPHAVFHDQGIDRSCGTRGTATEVTIEDVIAVNGPRVPAHTEAQRDFRIGTIVLSHGRLLSAEEMAFFTHMAARGEAREELRFTSGFARGMTKPFFLATGGRGTLTTRVR